MRIGYDSHYSYITTCTGYHDALLTLYWLSQNSTGTQKQVTSSIPALLLSIIPYPSKSNMMIPLVGHQHEIYTKNCIIIFCGLAIIQGPAQQF